MTAATKSQSAVSSGAGDKQRSSYVSRMEGLYNRANAQLRILLRCGHTRELEDCVGTLHLALSCLEGTTERSRAQLLRNIADRLVEVYAVGTNRIDDPIQSDAPLAFVVSYPRSGNTAMTQALTRLFTAQIFEGFPHSASPFSKAIYPKHYPIVRLIKDHVARQEYRQDKALILVRDGRDAMTSLAYMTHRQGRHDFTKKGELASFIRWLDTDYPFGAWPQHMRDVRILMAGPDKLLVRYEDYMSAPQTLSKAAAFLDPENGFSDEEILDAYRAAEELPEKLKNHPINNEWGFGMQFDPGSMFYEWAQHRQGSHWRLAWDMEAKRAFHETGATEFLIEHGYETDPDWWKRDTRHP